MDFNLQGGNVFIGFPVQGIVFKVHLFQTRRRFKITVGDIWKNQRLLIVSIGPLDTHPQWSCVQGSGIPSWRSSIQPQVWSESNYERCQVWLIVCIHSIHWGVVPVCCGISQALKGGQIRNELSLKGMYFITHDSAEFDGEFCGYFGDTVVSQQAYPDRRVSHQVKHSVRNLHQFAFWQIWNKR